MSYSLNEVEALSKRATKAVGYGWGMAEESSKATRWLCANGFDGCGLLAALLTEIDGANAETRQLCPLAFGAKLLDSRAQTAQASGVLYPAFVLAFVAANARLSAKVFSVEIGDSIATFDVMGRLCRADIAALSASSADLSFQIIEKIDQPLPLKTRAIPSTTDWQTLTELGLRTFAPATEESRRLGAG